MRKATRQGGTMGQRPQKRNRRPQNNGGRPQNRCGKPQRDNVPRIQKEFSRDPIITKITPFGLFAYHEAKQIKKSTWGKNPTICANKYIDKDEEIKKFNNSIPIKARRSSEGIFGSELLSFALNNEFKDEKEFNEFFQVFTLELTKLKLKYGFKKDKLIVQAISNFEEVTKMLNVFYERLSEWYGFYFPEGVKKIEDLEEFANIVGNKRHGKSMGYDLEAEDLKMIEISGEEMRDLISYKNKLNYYIEDIMNTIAPNISNVAGSLLGAKLIASAGNLERLSKMTSSTVQLLGAEKALFRHLRKGSNPPKYGLILQHTLMKSISPNNRGKFARSLSGKIAIAAKVDFNSKGKGCVWKELNEDLKKRLNGLN